MSCEGTMIGLPLAGERMLLVDIISTRASRWASRLSGTCTAIWSPSKSALKAWQTSGWTWIALPSISTGSNAWMPRRGSVGGGVSRTGGPAVARLALDQHRLERLDAEAVQRRGAVQQNRVLRDDLLEHVPDLGRHRVDVL